jgi:hypothetical protein
MPGVSQRGWYLQKNGPNGFVSVCSVRKKPVSFVKFDSALEYAAKKFPGYSVMVEYYCHMSNCRVVGDLELVDNIE